KFFGTLMILIMLASIAFVGLAIYFVILNPFYKDHDINKPVEYEQMATDTDVTNIESRPALFEVSIEDATETDAEAIATDGDASDETDTDVDENEDGDETDDENTDNEDSDNEDSDSDESVEE
ncbi:MAG: hypothetical protein IJZ96_07310, partial [Lachnospiraceae bacterium]|nr:hypothetical protein [Lachnospiraceae bacterium]